MLLSPTSVISKKRVVHDRRRLHFGEIRRIKGRIPNGDVDKSRNCGTGTKRRYKKLVFSDAGIKDVDILQDGRGFVDELHPIDSLSDR